MRRLAGLVAAGGGSRRLAPFVRVARPSTRESSGAFALLPRRYTLGASRAAGFTLIELLVVITIVAILAGAVVINLDFRNPAKLVRDQAYRTALLMQMAADQAVYARRQFGIRFHPNSYEFYMLDDSDDGNQRWQFLPDERLRFDPMTMPFQFEVDISGVPIVLEELEVEVAAATAEDPLKPHVLFLSNGEVMPDFRVVIADEDAEHRYELRTGEVEPIVVERLE